jgi:hypothetical protein
MTHTTRVRILAARAIVPARDLDRFPAGERFEQLTQQRRLPNFGSEPTNTDYNWLFHTFMFRVQALACALFVSNHNLKVEL